MLRHRAQELVAVERRLDMVSRKRRVDEARFEKAIKRRLISLADGRSMRSSLRASSADDCTMTSGWARLRSEDICSVEENARPRAPAQDVRRNDRLRRLRAQERRRAEPCRFDWNALSSWRERAERPQRRGSSKSESKSEPLADPGGRRSSAHRSVRGRLTDRRARPSPRARC